MGAPDQDTGLALGVWPQLGIVLPELALERFCRPSETDRGLGQVGGCTLCPSPVFNASKYSTLLETLTRTYFFFRNVKMLRKQAAVSFPICCQTKVSQAGISNGAEELQVGCRTLSFPQSSSH